MKPAPPYPHPITVALCADDRMAMPMAVAMRSIVDHHRAATPLEFVILADGIRGFKRSRILRSIEGSAAAVDWRDDIDDPRLRRLSYDADYPKPTYYRLLLAEILPHRSRAIYADVDTVFRDDIEKLWATPMRDADHVLAVLEPTTWTLGRSKGLAQAVEARGLSPDTPYPNNGLMVIDLDKWRAQRIGERSLDYVEREAQGRFRDMDALAVLFDGRWGELEPRWNSMHPVFESPADTLPYGAPRLRAARDNPAVVHFSGRPKPWERGCTHPLVHLFYEHLDRTAWRGWRNRLWRRLLRRAGLELERLARRAGAAALGSRIPRLVQLVID